MDKSLKKENKGETTSKMTSRGLVRLLCHGRPSSSVRFVRGAAGNKLVVDNETEQKKPVKLETEEIEKMIKLDELFAPFFDKPLNWGRPALPARERPGRPWNSEELRGKSNKDLHIIWFLLLKERNMLLTMQREHFAKYKPLANPERIDKVEESMAALEDVVEERNRAYSLLENGHEGTRHTKRVTSFAGFVQDLPLDEHHLPPSPDDKKYERPMLSDDEHMMQLLWKEQEWADDNERRSDYLLKHGFAKQFYRSEKELKPFVDAHPKNRLSE